MKELEGGAYLRPLSSSELVRRNVSVWRTMAGGACMCQPFSAHYAAIRKVAITTGSWGGGAGTRAGLWTWQMCLEDMSRIEGGRAVPGCNVQPVRTCTRADGCWLGAEPTKCGTTELTVNGRRRASACTCDEDQKSHSSGLASPRCPGSSPLSTNAPPTRSVSLRLLTWWNQRLQRLTAIRADGCECRRC